MRFFKIVPCFFLWFIFKSSQAHIQENRNFRFGSGSLRKVGHFSFLCPNELNPFRQTAILNEAPPEGVYLALGTERGLFGLGISRYKFDHVILADHDPAVIYFNEINLALIEASESLIDYIALRFARNIYEFQVNLKKQNYIPKRSIDLREIKHGRWFIRQMHLSKKEFLDACLNGSLANVYFQNEEHYNTLRNMVMNGKIVTRYLELNMTNPFVAIERELEKADMKVSVLDLSNAWWKRYIKKPDREFMLGPNQFHENGIVVVTDKEIDDDYSKNREFSLNWTYYGFLRSQLLQLSQSGDVNRNLATLYSCEGCLLKLFPNNANQLVNLDFWQLELDFEADQFLDEPAKKEEEEQTSKVGCWCFKGLFHNC
ncbi:MAG: hypothetical protein AB8G05_14015 [Oligoflexales bacterium]